MKFYLRNGVKHACFVSLVAFMSCISDSVFATSDEALLPRMLRSDYDGNAGTLDNVWLLKESTDAVNTPSFYPMGSIINAWMYGRYSMVFRGTSVTMTRSLFDVLPTVEVLDRPSAVSVSDGDSGAVDGDGSGTGSEPVGGTPTPGSEPAQGGGTPGMVADLPGDDTPTISLLSASGGDDVVSTYVKNNPGLEELVRYIGNYRSRENFECVNLNRENVSDKCSISKWDKIASQAHFIFGGSLFNIGVGIIRVNDWNSDLSKKISTYNVFDMNKLQGGTVGKSQLSSFSVSSHVSVPISFVRPFVKFSANSNVALRVSGNDGVKIELVKLELKNRIMQKIGVYTVADGQEVGVDNHVISRGDDANINTALIASDETLGDVPVVSQSYLPFLDKILGVVREQYTSAGNKLINDMSDFVLGNLVVDSDGDLVSGVTAKWELADTIVDGGFGISFVFGDVRNNDFSGMVSFGYHARNTAPKRDYFRGYSGEISPDYFHVLLVTNVVIIRDLGLFDPLVSFNTAFEVKLPVSTVSNLVKIHAVSDDFKAMFTSNNFATFANSFDRLFNGIDIKFNFAGKFSYFSWMDLRVGVSAGYRSLYGSVKREASPASGGSNALDGFRYTSATQEDIEFFSRAFGVSGTIKFTVGL